MIRVYKNLSTKFLNLVDSLKQASFRTRLIFKKQSSFFHNQHCYLCDEALRHNPFFCDACYLDLPKNKTKCAICNLPLFLENSPLGEATLSCGECIMTPPSFTKTVCPFRYEFPIKEIIKQIKYSKQQYWIKTLCWSFNQELIQYFQNDHAAKPDLLIPIPMHKTKLKLRGYNQAELIAKTLSKNTDIPIVRNALIKTKPTDTQAQLSKQERMKNLKGSFSIAKKTTKQETLKGKHIALIDDVMTTKATCELASKLLLNNGARQVDIWCLARTPKIK